MAISSNSSNMGVTRLQQAQIEIDNLLSKELARKKKNDDNMSEQAKKDMGSYKTPYEIKLENAKKVYDFIGNEPTHIDEIINHCGMTTDKTLSAITELEIYGLVTQLSGRRYKININ